MEKMYPVNHPIEEIYNGKNFIFRYQYCFLRHHEP